VCLSAKDIINFTLTEVGLYVYYGSKLHVSVPNVIKFLEARFGKCPLSYVRVSSPLKKGLCCIADGCPE